jgi:hypothetical protein
MTTDADAEVRTASMLSPTALATATRGPCPQSVRVARIKARQTGIPKAAQLSPVPSARNRIGWFYFDVLEGRWEKLVDVTESGEFIVQEPGKSSRTHTDILDARYFAKKPFDVAKMYGNSRPL